MEIQEAQRLAWANKVAKGFNTTDVALEFMLLHGEVAEASRHGGEATQVSAKSWPT